jgi:predicted nucleic acid-binding protein
VKYFLDTSVLVAAVLVQHMHYEPSLAVYRKTQKAQACCAAHSLAEVYATLTRLPGEQRMGCEQVLLVLADMRTRLTTIALDEEDYVSAIASAAAEGVLGGTVYDALLARCALKANVATIYTWNVSHFQRLGQEVARRVRTP